ncbi:hypothetical protein GCM10008959_39250 [Deinococcus seoulensis]|uniref:Uncharacterized protein n=1 Tax=Deinococcus seoulensis TaxID=1837379 RepID=A0ABQ2RXW8_9DEIO|nr:hypothetical protein [Deinococcus seoulensis]GGR74157.1 hypothetical protein GCM10008959_39250 [Deinococcus seoulensis]
MDPRTHDLHLLHITGDERRSFEEKRWIFMLLLLSPLIGLTATYAVQLTQPVREPYVIYLYPVMAPVMLGALLWNLLGGYSRLAERITVVVQVALALLHNLSFALQPTLPDSPSFVGSASYWTLVLNACVILLLVPVQRAVWLVVTLYLVCVALPWTLNFDVFRPYLAAMVRTQGMVFSVLLAILCLAWYRQRYVERAREAMMLRQLATTDLFAVRPDLSAERAGGTVAGPAGRPSTDDPIPSART